MNNRFIAVHDADTHAEAGDKGHGTIRPVICTLVWGRIMGNLIAPVLAFFSSQPSVVTFTFFAIVAYAFVTALKYHDCSRACAALGWFYATLRCHSRYACIRL